MKILKRVGKIALILLGVVCLGFSFCGCFDVSKTISDFIIIQLLFVNTLLLIGVLVYLIWRFGIKK